MTFNPTDGSTVTIEVETAVPTVFVQLLGVDRYSRKSGRASTKRSVFMVANQVKSTGALDEQVTLAGLVDPADPGLLRILAMKAADTSVLFKFTHNGTDGYKQLIKVANFDVDNTPDDFITFSGVLEAETPAVIVGAGPIF